MKQVFLTIVLLLSLAGAGFARGNNKNTKLFQELANTLKAATQTNMQTSAAFKSTAFTYNGKEIRAFFDNAEGDLIGFSIHLSAAGLPAGVEANIQKKYNGWAIKEAMMFIDKNSIITYYASVSKAQKQTLALKIGANNKPYIYARM